MIDDKTIKAYYLWFSRNFGSMEDIKRKYNLMVDLSKFTSNKKILSGVLLIL